MLFRGQKYHAACFKCSRCCHLLKLNSVDEATKPYWKSKTEETVCGSCHAAELQTCARCKQLIRKQDVCMEISGMYFHSDIDTCCNCQVCRADSQSVPLFWQPSRQALYCQEHNNPQTWHDWDATAVVRRCFFRRRVLQRIQQTDSINQALEGKDASLIIAEMLSGEQDFSQGLDVLLNCLLCPMRDQGKCVARMLRKEGTSKNPRLGSRCGVYAANDFTHLVKATEDLAKHAEIVVMQLTKAVSEKAYSIPRYNPKRICSPIMHLSALRYKALIKAYDQIASCVSGRPFAEYLNRMPACQQQLNTLTRACEPFGTLVNKDLLKQPACGGASLGGLMIKPLQRTVGYMLLF